MDRGGLPNMLYALISVMALLVVGVSGSLSREFYNELCPDLMQIVRDAMNITAENDPVNLPAVLRLFAHDALVSGVDASVLLDSTSPTQKAEKDAPPNLTLFGFEAVEFVKAEVETACPGIVSCADILTLAAQIAIEMTGGPVYQSFLGRRDGRVSRYSDVAPQLPTENMNFSQLSSNFAAKGLNTADLVVLSGAHTIGFAHCASFSKRIYNFSPAEPMDPTLDWTLGQQLQNVCPRRFDANTVQPLDITTIETFDESYYFNLQIDEGILASDQVLYSSSQTNGLVDQFAGDRDAFFTAFVTSMLKLGGLGVLTGNQGEIRQVCFQINPTPPPPPPPPTSH